MLSLNFQDVISEAERPSYWARLTDLAWLIVQHTAIKLKVRLLVMLVLKRLKEQAIHDVRHLIPILNSVNSIDFTKEDTSKFGNLISHITRMIDEVGERQTCAEQLSQQYTIGIDKITIANEQTLTALYNAIRKLKKHSFKKPKSVDEMAISAASKSAETISRIYAC